MSDAPAPQPPAVGPELESEPGASKEETRWLAMVFGGIAAGYLGLILTFELGAKPPTPSWFKGPAFKAMNMDAALGVCGLLGFLGLLAWGVLRRHPRVHTPQLRRFASASLIALVVASVFISFYGRKVQQRNFTQMHDTFHYGLGPKYFEELGKAALGNCFYEDVPE